MLSVAERTHAGDLGAPPDRVAGQAGEQDGAQGGAVHLRSVAALTTVLLSDGGFLIEDAHGFTPGQNNLAELLEQAGST